MTVKRYVITTAVPGQKANRKFLSTILNYCAKNSARLLILPSANIRKTDELDPIILDTGCVVTKDVVLNKNIRVCTMTINPESEDPIYGLDRLVHKLGSLVLASPKLRMKSIPSPKTGIPKILMTPGAVTNPNKRLTRKGLIASKDHVNSAIVVEIKNSRIFHYRQLVSNSDGHFYDLCKKYTQNSVESVTLEALVPGDYHVGYTDPKVRDVVFSIAKLMKPKYIFLHDFFDGISVNHHIQHKILQKALLKDKNDLTEELKLCAKELTSLSPLAKRLVIVKSNHDEFLDKWLDEAKYLSSEVNHVIGLELALAKARGRDPLKSGICKFAKFNNVTFLKSDQSFKITQKQIECGVHGHLGPNGAKGYTKGLEKAYGNIIFGHTHTPEILREAWVVGTSSLLKLNYNKGPSSWMHTLALVYPNGSKQLINVIDGEWKL